MDSITLVWSYNEVYYTAMKKAWSYMEQYR